MPRGTRPLGRGVDLCLLGFPQAAQLLGREEPGQGGPLGARLPGEFQAGDTPFFQGSAV